MFFWAGLLFFILELTVFGAIIDELGFFTTLFLWLCTVMGGIALVQRQGMAVALRAQEAMRNNTVPVDDLFDSVCLFIAGALFILPGFLSDVLAFTLLIPPFRRWVRTRIPKRFNMAENGYKRADDGVIDGTYVRVVDPVDVIEQRKEPPQ